MKKINKLIEDEGLYHHLIKGKDGYFLYNKNDTYVGRSLEKYGEFSELEGILLEQFIQEQDVVIEVGSNIGAHTIRMAKKASRGVVYAFELQRIVYYNLAANIALNSLNNVIAYNIALSDEKGSIKCKVPSYHEKGNFGGLSLNVLKNDVGIETAIDTLDNICGDISRCKLIKVDVEGMEESVLRGAKNIIEKYKPVLYLENDRPEKAQSLMDYINSIGYKMYLHKPPLYNPKNFIGDDENVFERMCSLNMICFHKSVKLKIDVPEITKAEEVFKNIKKK